MIFDWNLSLVIEIYLVLGVRDLVCINLGDCLVPVPVSVSSGHRRHRR
jgi:hypothetical protein